MFTQKVMKTILDINFTFYTPVPFKMCKSATQKNEFDVMIKCAMCNILKLV